MGDLIKSVRQKGMKDYTKHELYTTWRMMNYRCCSPVHNSYGTYGGCGITVCDEWRWDNPNGFVNFLADKSQRPVGHTLDRIDPYGSYTNENTRWATKLVQQNNFRTSEDSTTGVTGVIITPEGLYKAQTMYLGKPWSIIITEDLEKAKIAAEAVREYKLAAPDEDSFVEFVKSFADISPTGKKLHVRKTSKYYGVSWNKAKRKWRASGYNKTGEGKTVVFLGYFLTEDEAFEAVQKFLVSKEKR